MIRAIVFDTGALIAAERRASSMSALIANAAPRDRIIIPAPVLAQAWRGGARQAALGLLLRLEAVTVDLLTVEQWRAAGVLCGRTSTSDVVDAAVVVCAHSHGARVIVTSDPDDIARLDPGLRLFVP